MAKDYSQAADVYSFAVLTWSVLAQRAPYTDLPSSFGKTPLVIIPHTKEIYKYVCEGNRPKIPDGVPEPIEEMIKSCWAQNAESRPDFVTIYKFLSTINL